MGKRGSGEEQCCLLRGWASAGVPGEFCVGLQKLGPVGTPGWGRRPGGLWVMPPGAPIGVRIAPGRERRNPALRARRLPRGVSGTQARRSGGVGCYRQEIRCKTRHLLQKDSWPVSISAHRWLRVFRPIDGSGTYRERSPTTPFWGGSATSRRQPGQMDSRKSGVTLVLQGAIHGFSSGRFLNLQLFFPFARTYSWQYHARTA
jgi:hypothetical protein